MRANGLTFFASLVFFYVVLSTDIKERDRAPKQIVNKLTSVHFNSFSIEWTDAWIDRRMDRQTDIPRCRVIME